MSKRSLAVSVLLFGAMVFPMTLQAQILVQFPQGPAIWSVEVTKSPAPRGGPPTTGSSVTSEAVSQDAKKRQTQITTSDGVTSVEWSITGGNMLLIMASNGNVLTVPMGVVGGMIYDLPFSESAFSWIKPEMLVEKNPISYAGKLCFHYKGKASVRVTAYSEPIKYTAEAWIDSKTLLPVAIDNGAWLATYTFHPPPYPPLVLPPEFQKDFDRLSR